MTDMQKKKLGIGAGLSMLKHGLDDLTAPVQPTSMLTEIALDCIKPARYQTRQKYDPEKMQGLADSIKEQGVLQPIVVRKAGEGFELIAGERRCRASRQAGLTKIPAIIKEVDGEVMAAFTLIENIQRENLNSIEEAQAYQKLIDDFGLTHDEVAKRVSKPRATVSNFLRLLKLTESVKQCLIDRKIEMGHAKVLLALTGDQQITAAQIIMNRNLSVRQTEAFVQDMFTYDTDAERIEPALFHKQKKASQDFSELFGKQVKVMLKKDGTEQGKVQFTFRSFKELDTLYDKLTSIKEEY